jgi:hypothetical protein
MQETSFSVSTVDPNQLVETGRRRLVEMRPHGGRRGDEALAEDRIAQVVGRLLGSGETVPYGDVRSPEAGELWEHPPDPVTGLAAGLQLMERSGKAGARIGLRGPEATQVVHGDPPRWTSTRSDLT